MLNKFISLCTRDCIDTMQLTHHYSLEIVNRENCDVAMGNMDGARPFLGVRWGILPLCFSIGGNRCC